MFASHTGDFFCVGGQAPYTNLVEVYNLYTDQWRTGTAAPFAQCAGGGCSDGRFYGYTVGGIGGPSNAAVQRYDFLAETWTCLTNAPTHRWSLQVALVGNTILAVGGLPAPASPSPAPTDVYVSDISADTWAAKNPIPSSSGVVNALVGRSGKFFVMNESNKFHSFTVATNAWLTLSAAPNPHNKGPGVLMPSGHFVICLHDTATKQCDQYDTLLVETSPWAHFNAVPTMYNMYTHRMGQHDNDFIIAAYNVAHKFQGAQGQWVTINNMPTHRHDVAVVVSSAGTCVLVGGVPTTAVVEGYNCISDQWTTLRSSPSAQYGSGSCSDGAYGYVIGGTISPTTTSTALLRYEFGTDVWTSRTAMPTGRTSFQCDLDAGLVVCVGHGPVPPKLNEAYTIATDTWVTKQAIPTDSGIVHVVLGRDGQFFVLNVFNDFHKYTVATDEWVTLDRSPLDHNRGPGVLMPSGHIIVCTAFPSTRMCSEYDTGLVYTAPAVAASDPHMRGFHGHLFLFESEPGTVVNLFSSSTLQVNALLDRPINAPHTWRLVIAQVGVKARVGDDVLSIVVDSYGKVSTDIKPMATQLVGETFHFAFGEVLLSAGTGVRVTTHLYSLQVIPQRLPDSANDYFHYLDVLVNPSQWQPDTVHGILGQTIRPDIPWPRSSFVHEVKDPFEYLEGTLADYVVESGDLLGDPLRFDLFDPFGAYFSCPATTPPPATTATPPPAAPTPPPATTTPPPVVRV